MFVYLAFCAVTVGAAFVAHRLGRVWANVPWARALVFGPFALALVASVLGMALGPRAFPVAVLPAAVASVCLTHVIACTRVPPLAGRDAALPLRVRYALQRPRVYFGALILVGAAAGLLPWAFARPIGLGDIAVGLLGVALGRVPASHPWARGLAVGFAIVGIADLLNALRLGVQVAVPALVASQTPPMLLMLPFYVVPVLLAQHLLMLRRMNSREHLT
jgi:hypothetical protein